MTTLRRRPLSAALTTVLATAAALAAAPAAEAAAAPGVTTVKVNVGPLAGGTRITVVGSGFVHVRAVLFGTTAGTRVQVLSSTRLTVTAPRHGAGVVDVHVRTSAGTSRSTVRDRYTYLPAPTVTALAPAAGGVGGGEHVVVSGTNFSHVASVSFGTVRAASFSVASTGRLVAVAPASQAVRTVDVRVTTAGGTSALGAHDRYTYRPRPTITAVTPAQGPLTGGNRVVIDGHDFTAITQVLMNGHAASAVTAVSPTRVIVTAPAGVGTGDVRVVGVYGTSPLTTADHYAVVARPTAPTRASVVAPAPVPDAGPAHVLDTGCTDTTCYAVGSTADGQPLVETLGDSGWTPAVLALPAGATGGDLAAIWCGSSTCAAVGSADGTDTPLVETLADGTWTQVDGVLPPAATSGSYDRIACAGDASTCVATGTSSNGVLLAASVGGTWQAQDAPMPGLGQLADLTRVDVACAAAGHCVFVGNWAPTSGSARPLVETWSGTTWTPSVVQPPVVNAATVGGSGTAAAIACPAAGCMIAGSWTPDQSPASRPMVASEANGLWTSTLTPMPADADQTVDAALTTIACSAGTCTASGTYQAPPSNEVDPSYPDGFVETLHGGMWFVGAMAKGSADIYRVTADTVCTDATHCVSVGTDTPLGSDSGVATGAIAVTGPGGATQAVAPLPGDASDLSLFHVACSTSATCVAVGRLSTPQQWLLTTIRL
ncbi:MAG: IPT/TIG domain-containing protein [Jatrophihabitans sp.]|uniref:IPT/TIG domain-containing protein n=1 Tax=Jatrophihabitans sp. TaxID=1932789 RepID=UPI003F821450